MPERVLIVGQGYVGLPLAVRACEVGYSVTGFDVDDERIATLARGRSYVEDVTASAVLDALASGRYRPLSDPERLEPFDIAVISVPTPLVDGTPDLSYIESAARTVATVLTEGACVVLESTTYPGTTEELVGPILSEHTGLDPGRHFRLGYSPERIDPGNRTHTLVTTPKVVSGVDAESLTAVEGFYARLVDSTVPVASVKVAELTKLLENTFRHVNIALMNELAMFAHELGIDLGEAIDAASTKPFGYMRFTPGPGVGGHCLPVDPSYLSWRVKQSLGHSFRFVELANDVNAHMPEYVVARLTDLLNDRGLSVKGRRILLLGLAYKRNTGDARESPSALVARALVGLGADVAVADPHVDPAEAPAGTCFVKATPDQLEAADLVVGLVDHDEFEPELVVGHAQLVLDCKRWLNGPNVEHL